MASVLPDVDNVVATLKDMMTAVQSVAPFKTTAALVFDRDDVEDKLTGLKTYPAAVVQYEGMRETGRNDGKGSNSALLVASIMVVNSGEGILRTDTKIPTILLLSALRGEMLHRKAPSGHFWEFLVEAPASTSKNLSFWVQRWQVPIQFQPRVPRR